MKTDHARPTAIYMGLAIGVIAVSFSAVIIRLADAPFLVIAATRTSLATLVIAPMVVAYRRGQSDPLTKRELWLTGASALCLSLHFAFWIASLSHTSVVSSVVLVTTSPILVALVSHFFTKEPVTRLMVAGIGLASLGSLILGWGDFRVSWDELYGDILAVLGAVAAGGYLLLGRRVRLKMPVLRYSLLVYGIAALVLLGATALAGENFTGYSGKTYIMLALIALVPQLIGHSSLNWALGYVSATLVAVAIMLEPVGATILAWLMLDEAPRITSVLGGVLILLGVYLVMKRQAGNSQ